MNKIILFFLKTFSVASAQPSDLFIESEKKDSAIVIYVHGGAWVSGRPEDYIPLAKSLSKRGLCVVLAKYSLAPAFKHPAQIKELHEQIIATTKLKQKNCNSQKIFLVGHSAGAHMIAFWASEFNHPSIKGFIGLEGIYDLNQLAKTWPSYVDWFIKPTFTEEKMWSSASPNQLKLNSKSPWLLVHSKKDELVDINQTIDFNKHLLKSEIPAQLLQLEKETHFGVVQKLMADQKSSEVQKAVLKFVNNP